MKITEKCFAVTGLFYLPPWTVNSGFVVGNRKTLVIDSSVSYLSAQTIYGYASLARPSNELILVNTEKHLDHIGGNSFFAEKGIPIYGHYLIRRKESDFENQLVEAHNFANFVDPQRADEGKIAFDRTRIVNPSFPILEDTEFDLGNLNVDILLTPGHTDTNISVHCPSDGVVYVGDCIVNAYSPNIGEANRENWLNSLEVIESLNIETIVPGHGELINGRMRILEEITRMRKILKFS